MAGDYFFYFAAEFAVPAEGLEEGRAEVVDGDGAVVFWFWGAGGVVGGGVFPFGGVVVVA